MSTGQGSTGNVIAALCSLFVPGLGQLLQGRILWALIWFGLGCLAGGLTWLLTVGLFPFGWFLVSLLSCLHAAMFRRT